LFNYDIATGMESTAGTGNDTYRSIGRPVPDVSLIPGAQDLTYCYTYAASSCYDWQIKAIQNGTAEICNWLFVDANTTSLFPETIAKCRADWAKDGGGNATSAKGPTVNVRSLPMEGMAASRKSVWWPVVIMTIISYML
jgi:hypothetical protein